MVLKNESVKRGEDQEKKKYDRDDRDKQTTATNWKEAIDALPHFGAITK